MNIRYRIVHGVYIEVRRKKEKKKEEEKWGWGQETRGTKGEIKREEGGKREKK